MAYTGTYVGTDLGNLFIDLFASIAKTIADNGATIAIILVVGMIAIFGGRAVGNIFGVFKNFR